MRFKVESDVRSASEKLLGEHGYIVIRSAVKRGSGGYTGMLGQSDTLVVLSRGRVVWLEFKHPDYAGKAERGLDPAQVEFRRLMESRGHTFIVAATPAEALTKVRQFDVRT